MAATLDPDQGIKNWIQQELRARPIGHEVLEKYKIIAANSDEVPTPAASPNPHAQVASPGQISGQAEAKSKTDDIKVEQLSDKVNVEDVYFINNEEKSVAPKVDAAPPPDDGFQQLEKR